MHVRLVAKPDNLTEATHELLDPLDGDTFPLDGLHPKEGRWWWVAYDDTEPVGFAGLRVIGNEAWLSRCGVLESHRGYGIQRRLIQARCAYVKRSCLLIRTYTMCDNTHSANNLIRCGFLMDSIQDDGEAIWWHRRL